MDSDSWISKKLLVAAVFIFVLVFGAIKYFHQEAGLVQNEMNFAARKRAAKSQGTLEVVEFR